MTWPQPRRKTYRKREIEGRKHISSGWAVSPDPDSKGFETQDFPTHFLFPGTTSKRIFHSRLSLFLSLSLFLNRILQRGGGDAYISRIEISGERGRSESRIKEGMRQNRAYLLCAVELQCKTTSFSHVVFAKFALCVDQSFFWEGGNKPINTLFIIIPHMWIWVHVP